ncbi:MULTISPECIES: hypothetical protein [Paenibacillus]|uniref:hypothetical protein n=1 Tax=Paenibacillus TaxID=44249 RepID=UPI00117E2BC5|nr:hypothetical protein [Paenibacillus odorifer]
MNTTCLGRRSHQTPDPVSNLPTNVLITKETCHANHLLYKRIIQEVTHVANNIVGPHEHMIVQLLFVGDKKYRYKDAVEYMRRGYMSVVYGSKLPLFPINVERLLHHWRTHCCLMALWTI